MVYLICASPPFPLINDRGPLVKLKHSGGVENNIRYCFIVLFQSFMFYLSMKILSSNYCINIVKIYTQQS